MVKVLDIQNDCFDQLAVKICVNLRLLGIPRKPFRVVGDVCVCMHVHGYLDSIPVRSSLFLQEQISG